MTKLLLSSLRDDNNNNVKGHVLGICVLICDMFVKIFLVKPVFCRYCSQFLETTPLLR